MEKIRFITGNPEKISIARNGLKESNLNIIPLKLDCVEIQHDDIAEIAKKSVLYAVDQINKNAVKTDTGLFIEALNGFPGPYTAYAERHLDARDILKLMIGRNNRKAYYKDVLAFCEYGKEPVIFETCTYGTVAKEMSGTFGLNFDRIFILDGDSEPMAHYKDDERIAKYSIAHWQQLANYIESKDSYGNSNQRMENVGDKT